MRLFFEKSFILTIEEVVEHFSDLDNNDDEKINFADNSKASKDKVSSIDLSFKSHTRRLYDIANVLISLGIIEKVKYRQKKIIKNQKEKKNAYRWIGSKGFNLIDNKDSQRALCISQQHLSDCGPEAPAAIRDLTIEDNSQDIQGNEE